MADDFACHLIKAAWFHNEQVPDGRCKSTVLFTISGTHAPLLVKAFTNLV